MVSTWKNLKSPASTKHATEASPVFWQDVVFSFPVSPWKLSRPTLCPSCGDRVMLPCCDQSCLAPTLLPVSSQRSGWCSTLGVC